MSRVVAIGEATELAGFGLVGVEVVAAPSAESARRAWETLGGDVGLVLLTSAARQALHDPIGRGDLLWVVLPT